MMTSGLSKRSDLVKRVSGIGVKARGLPEIFARPKNMYSKVATYFDGERRLAGSLLEVASTYEERKRGLMYRKTLPWVCGMLFEDLPSVGYFWMKNCLVDLDLVLLDKDGEVAWVYSMPADDGERRYAHAGEKTAIEVPMGFCEKYGIKKGCKVKIKDIGGKNG